jgi:uncharacterized SAM-binding protein YcdF (DUF218 family)
MDSSKESNALVVLGAAGWRENADGSLSTGEILQERINAAILIIGSNNFDSIICVGGYTAGELNPSEADVIARSIKSYFDIHTDKSIPVIVEDQSLDTAENFRNIQDNVNDLNPNKITILSHSFHLGRAEMLARIMLGEGRKFGKVPADLVTAYHNKRSYITFPEVLRRFTRNVIIEAIATPLLAIDPQGRIPSLITRRRGKK